MGLTLDDLINGYLEKIISDDIHAPEQMTPRMEKFLSKSEASIQQGNVTPTQDNIADFIRDLESNED